MLAHCNRKWEKRKDAAKISKIIRDSGLVVDKKSRRHFRTTWVVVGHVPQEMHAQKQDSRDIRNLRKLEEQ